ncbi:MAG: glycoside hydrolase, partial [Chloroflexota bacterium]
AFHAHEPSWDLPAHILESLDDVDLRLTLGSENWLVRRSAEGRDIYLELLRFAQNMGIPVTLETSNELLAQLSKIMPETFTELGKAYREGIIYPLYGHAHHTHVCLLTEEEIEDEIRLNKDYLHQVLGVPYPRYAGLFPTEDSLDAAKLGAIERSGIDYVIFPNLDRRRDRYRVEGTLHQPYEPFRIGSGLVALERHFPVSQDIWRPITKWKHEGVRNQGYLLGRYRVFPEEYRRKKFVRFPITREEAVAEYQRVLRRALKKAPDRGLILYIQDLELMDFGDIALDVMEAAWKAVLGEGLARVRFVTPDRYLEEAVFPKRAGLPMLRFHQVSWAPEIRLVLRYDGHYPPLGAGEFRGVDLVRTVFRRWPFIFWEPGRYLVALCNWLTDLFGFPQKMPFTAEELTERGLSFQEMSVPERIALHSRIIKRACNWGWFPNEGLQKRPFLHGYCLADTLLDRLEQEAPFEQKDFVTLNLLWFRGLERLLEVILDTRHGYLMEALGKLSLQAGKDCQEAYKELERSRQLRDDARRSIFLALEHARRLNERVEENRVAELHGLLSAFRGYCRATFLSLEHIQRTWVKAGDTGEVLTAMYDYLYDLYPPKFPSILMSTLGDTPQDPVLH